jgi:type IV pilus assembly protein PilW
MSRRSNPIRGNQLGLTIIELMITVLLSSFLLLGILQLFINSNESDRANSSLARLQENGRIALDMLKQDLRRTGYQGCATPTTVSRANSSRTFPLDALGVQNAELNEGAGTASDSLVMRHATPRLMRATTISATQVTFIAGPNISFNPGDRYEFILTNCDEVAIFTGIASARVDNADPATQGVFPNQYTVSNLQGANNGAAPSLYGIPTGAGSQFLQVVQNAYSIANDATNNNRPTLFKNGAAMIADIDNFQVLYGVDNAGQTSWVNAANLTDALRQQVSRLQISLVVSSPDEIAGDVNNQAFAIANIGGNTQLAAIGDRRLRRVFNTIVDVRNRP